MVLPWGTGRQLSEALFSICRALLESFPSRLVVYFGIVHHRTESRRLLLLCEFSRAVPDRVLPASLCPRFLLCLARRFFCSCSLVFSGFAPFTSAFTTDGGGLFCTLVGVGETISFRAILGARIVSDPPRSVISVTISAPAAASTATALMRVTSVIVIAASIPVIITDSAFPRPRPRPAASSTVADRASRRRRRGVIIAL